MSPSENTSNDATLLVQAKEYMRNDQILAASRLVKQLSSSPDTIPEGDDTAFLKEVETKASIIEHIIADLLSNPEEHHEANVDDNVHDEATTDTTDENNNSTGQWTKQGESHGNRDTVMYYQVTEDLQLKCRLETPIESSLLVPLLSVLCETDLYTSWLPKWNYPKIGLGTVDKLAQFGRTEQLIQFISEVPWPFRARDVMLQTVACDDIHDIEGDTTGSISIGIHSLQEGDTIKKSTVCQPHYKDEKDSVDILPPPEGLCRAEVEGGLLFRKCPEDHITLQGSTIDYPPDEHLVLVGFSLQIDGKISPMFPKKVINFVIQTAISQMWAMFIKVAEDIRDGNRPKHSEVIAAKREEIYDWVDQRVEDMFKNLHGEKATKVEAEEGTSGAGREGDTKGET